MNERNRPVLTCTLIAKSCISPCQLRSLIGRVFIHGHSCVKIGDKTVDRGASLIEWRDIDIVSVIQNYLGRLLWHLRHKSKSEFIVWNSIKYISVRIFFDWYYKYLKEKKCDSTIQKTKRSRIFLEYILFIKGKYFNTSNNCAIIFLFNYWFFSNFFLSLICQIFALWFISLDCIDFVWIKLRGISFRMFVIVITT